VLAYLGQSGSSEQSTAHRPTVPGVHGVGSGFGMVAEGSSYGIAAYGSVGIYANRRPEIPFAGLFDGNVQINGSLTKSSARSRSITADPAIQVPLPLLVESPDMKNIYDGTVTLDEKARRCADARLFQRHESGFPLQLTAIGAPAPNLYVRRR